jgi:hypothetical protein
MGSLLGSEVLGDHRSFLGVKAMLLTTIVVTGIVFTMIGAAIGYILGFSVLQRHAERREHEINRCRTAAWKMGVGPPESACRSGSQTTPSGHGQKP